MRSISTYRYVTLPSRGEDIVDPTALHRGWLDSGLKVGGGL